MEDGFWFTVNNVEAIDLAEAGFNKPIDLSINRTAGTSEGAVEERPSEEKGAQLFKAVACAGCHSPSAATDGFYGPPFTALFRSARPVEGRSDEGCVGKESVSRC